MLRTSRCSLSFTVTLVLFLSSAVVVNGLYQDLPYHNGLAKRQGRPDAEVTPFADPASSAAEETTTSSTETSSSTSTSTSSTSTSTSETESSTSTTATSTEVPTTSSSSTPTSISSTPRPTTTAAAAVLTTSSSSETSIALVTSTAPATTLVLGSTPVAPLVSITSTTQPSSTPTVVSAAADAKTDKFWGNKAAVGATFAIVGLVGLGIFGAILMSVVRKQKQRQRYHTERDTIVWSDKPSEPFDRRGAHSPSHSINELANQTPMDAYGSRDPFQGSYDAGPETFRRPFASEEPRAESVYSQNMAGFGTVMTPAQGYAAEQPSAGGLAPPSAPVGHSAQPSLDSFYGAYGGTQNQAAGHAL